MGQSSPPVPAKLAEKIWKGEFVNLCALLPHAWVPQNLPLQLQRKSRKEDKQITSIEQWVAIRAPHRVRDLLAYMAMIVKAAHDFKGSITPSLASRTLFLLLLVGGEGKVVWCL